MPYPYKDEITGAELVAEYAPIIKGKTAKVLFSLGLANKFGDRGKEIFSLDRAVATHVFASFDPVLKVDHNGKHLMEKARVAAYYVDPVHPHAISDIEGDKLWELSAKAVGL
ncbi:hypothetical protein CCMA1212_004786 [Trichoderma ghanense]|uniref:Uncharacterized protein n=1 Tax=Trichoderma ghanense TaxID=65468 RepID=A0ABY2H771_9HYPO